MGIYGNIREHCLRTRQGSFVFSRGLNSVASETSGKQSNYTQEPLVGSLLPFILNKGTRKGFPNQLTCM